MAELLNLDADTGRNLIDDNNEPVLTLENQNTGADAHALTLKTAATGAPTCSALKIISSVASGTILEVNAGLISNASISVMAGAIPVLDSVEDKISYIPLYEVS